jgi:hypothetical protein
METLLLYLTLVKIGLFLNILGTGMVAFSFGKNLAEAHQINEKGRKIYLASYLHPILFKLGLVFIIIGFILQILD